MDRVSSSSQSRNIQMRNLLTSATLAESPASRSRPGGRRCRCDCRRNRDGNRRIRGLRDRPASFYHPQSGTRSHERKRPSVRHLYPRRTLRYNSRYPSTFDRRTQGAKGLRSPSPGYRLHRDEKTDAPSRVLIFKTKGGEAFPGLYRSQACLYSPRFSCSGCSILSIVLIE